MRGMKGDFVLWTHRYYIKVRKKCSSWIFIFIEVYLYLYLQNISLFFTEIVNILILNKKASY